MLGLEAVSSTSLPPTLLANQYKKKGDTMDTHYNADATYRSYRIQNEILGFTQAERNEVQHAFKRGYICGAMAIAAIKSRHIGKKAA